MFAKDMLPKVEKDRKMMSNLKSMEEKLKST